MVMKSGTNELHGSMWENMQPSNLTANSFFNNAKGLGNPLTHYNQYGLTAGGPVYLPKIWNGKDKLFWFFAWQHDKNTQPFTSFISVPTDAEKRGDFSQILQTDGTQLYDPYSASLNGSAIVRQPLPGNIIPTSRINPIAQQYLKFFPAPNVNGVNATSRPDGYFNYGTTAPNSNVANNESLQLDYNMSNRSRMSFNTRHNTLAGQEERLLPEHRQRTDHQPRKLGRQRRRGVHHQPHQHPESAVELHLHVRERDGFQRGLRSDVAGLSGSISARIRCGRRCPTSISTPARHFSRWATTRRAIRPSQSVQLYGSWTKLKGNHQFKVGTDVRQNRLSTITYGYASGGYNFGGNRLGATRMPARRRREAMGQDMAQFLYRPARPGLLRHQYVRLLVFLLRRPDSCRTIGA